MKKETLYALFLCIAMPLVLSGVIGFALSAAPRTGGTEEHAEEARVDGDCVTYIQWDDKDYYWTGSRVYEDLLCPDAVGTITSVVDGADRVTENGQTNAPNLKAGDEIRRTVSGDAIAVFVEDQWVWFGRRGPLGSEEFFYIPKNEWRPFRPNEGAACVDLIPDMKRATECGSVTLTMEQADMDAKLFADEPYVALVLKNDSGHAISYRRGALYVLKEIDGKWHYWLGETEPEDVPENFYEVPPSQEERFLAPIARAFPKTERDAGVYRIGMYVDYETGTDGSRRMFVSTKLTLR